MASDRGHNRHSDFVASERLTCVENCFLCRLFFFLRGVVSVSSCRCVVVVLLSSSRRSCLFVSSSCSCIAFFVALFISSRRRVLRLVDDVTATSFPGSTPLSRWRLGAAKTLGHAGEILHESWSILSRNTRSIVLATLDQRL